MATTHASEAMAASAVGRRRGALTLCHFSVLQTRLKSRAFHMECLPLAASGTAISYVSPASACHQDWIHFEHTEQRAGPFRRLLPALSLLRQLLRQRASVYHFQEPELLPLAFLLKLVFGKRVVYDAYEDFPSMMSQKARIPRLLRPIIKAFVSLTERLAANCLDGVITADPFTLRRLARTGRSRKLVFYNFPNLDVFPPPPHTPKKFDLVYRGGLSERAGTNLLLEALHLLARQGRRVTLLLIGYTDSATAEDLLHQRIRSLNLESQIEIRPRLDHEEMAAALSEARIGVSPLLAVPKFLLNIPVKIFEYWACGLPVVASDLPPIRPFFRIARGGLLFRPGAAADLARCLGWMLDHPESAHDMGHRGRDVVVHRFNNRSESRKLKRFCELIALSS